MAQLQPAQAETEPYLPDYAPDRVELNNEQQVIFDAVQSHLSPLHPSTKMLTVHLEAAAGSGKTFLCLCLCMAMAVRRNANSAICTAFTAKAASNYPDGHTAHYAFQLNVTNISESPSTRTKGTPLSHAHAFCTPALHPCKFHAHFHNFADFSDPFALIFWFYILIISTLPLLSACIIFSTAAQIIQLCNASLLRHCSSSTKFL
jgi:hypothetical protein